MKKVALSFILVNLLTACASTQTPEASQAQQGAPATAETTVISGQATTAAENTASAGTVAVNSEAATGTQAASTEAAQTAALPGQTEQAATAAATQTAPGTTDAAQTAATTGTTDAAQTAPTTGTTDAAQTAPTTGATANNTADTAQSAGAAADIAVKRVHFEFDNDGIQEADKTVIQAHGAYLSLNPTVKVRVEGNADERGSSEYNLALGQRRANNTKKALTLAGAKASQIQAISFGEEKPVDTGHDEAAWAQNRRVDIAY